MGREFFEDGCYEGMNVFMGYEGVYRFLGVKEWE